MPAGPAKLARFADTPQAPVLAHLDLAHRPPGRSPRERSSWTHYQGNRPGAASRSARDSTTLPTADQLAAHDGDRPSVPGVLAPTHHPGGRSSHPNDPARSRAKPRSQQASRPSDGWHADPNATAQSWPDTQAFRHGLQRCDATHVRSSTAHGAGGGRSHAPDSRGRGEERSLLAQQKTNSAPTPKRKRTGHPTILAEPTRTNRRRHTSRHTGVLARQPTGDPFPKPLPMLTAPDRRTTRRTHRRPQRTNRLLTLHNTHHEPPSSPSVATTN